jgi:hypothetical protein
MTNLIMTAFTLYALTRLVSYGFLGAHPLLPGEWWIIVSIVNYWFWRAIGKLVRASVNLRNALADWMDALAALLRWQTKVIKNMTPEE